MKRFFFWLISLGIGFYALSVITDNDHVWTGLRQCYLRGYKTAQIDDMGFQSLRSIPASESPRPWPLHSRYNSFDLPESLIDSTHRWNTTALTVIHRDSLLLDWKSDRIPGADTMRTNSFSVAKSLTALAIGAAEKEGLLSVHDRVSKYLPRFSEGPAAELTIEQVLQMRSGIPYGESYKNPFGFMSKCTYGDDILLTAWRTITVEGSRRCALEIPRRQHPVASGNPIGGHRRVSGCLVLGQRSGGPLERQTEAKWAVDNAGHERNYACFYTTASEFARWASSCWTQGKVDGTPGLERDFVAG